MDELTQLRFAAAVHDNALALAALPLLGAYWLDSLLRTARGKGTRQIQPTVVWLIVAAGLAFAIVRNLPAGAALRPR